MKHGSFSTFIALWRVRCPGDPDWIAPVLVTTPPKCGLVEIVYRAGSGRAIRGPVSTDDLIALDEDCQVWRTSGAGDLLPQMSAPHVPAAGLGEHPGSRHFLATGGVR